MRRLPHLLAPLILLLLAGTLHAGTVLDLEVRGADEPELVRLSFADGVLRLDRGPAGAEPETSLLYRPADDEVLFLDHREPRAVAYDPHTVHRIGRAMAGGGPTSDAAATPELVDTGRTGVTGGRSWRLVEVRAGGELVAEVEASRGSELGLTTGELSRLEGLFGLLGPLAESFGSTLGLGFPVDPVLRGLAADGLFPLAHRRLASAGPEGRAELVAVESRPLPAELFADPGYPRPSFEMEGH